MLHEASNPISPNYSILQLIAQLTHIVHGPHDDKFYKFLSDLESEYGALRSSGYSGEGFHAPGQRVGVGVSHNLPVHAARLKAAEAAEKRLQSAQRTRSGAVGGAPRPPGKSPRELAAEVS